MKLEGAEAIAQLQDLADSIKYQMSSTQPELSLERPKISDNAGNTEESIAYS